MGPNITEDWVGPELWCICSKSIQWLTKHSWIFPVAAQSTHTPATSRHNTYSHTSSHRWVAAVIYSSVPYISVHSSTFLEDIVIQYWDPHWLTEGPLHLILLHKNSVQLFKQGKKQKFEPNCTKIEFKSMWGSFHFRILFQWFHLTTLTLNFCKINISLKLIKPSRL